MSATAVNPDTRLERCDRCPAAARLRAVVPAGELYFCGHHARHHVAKLIELGARLGPADLAAPLR